MANPPTPGPVKAAPAPAKAPATTAADEPKLETADAALNEPEDGDPATVLVNSPATFEVVLNHAGVSTTDIIPERRYIVEKGISNIPRDVFDHWYVKAHGVAEVGAK